MTQTDLNFEREEQAEHLERVTTRIGIAIMQFFKRERLDFHAEELRTFIRLHVGVVAPGSPDRVMRDLRQRGCINYEVVNRRASEYIILRKDNEQR